MSYKIEPWSCGAWKIVTFLTFYVQNIKYKYYSLKVKPQVYVKVRFLVYFYKHNKIIFKFSLTFFILILLKVFGSCNGDSQATFLWMFSLNKIEAQFVTSRVYSFPLYYTQIHYTNAHTHTLINTHSNLQIHNTQKRTHIHTLSQHTHTKTKTH